MKIYKTILSVFLLFFLPFVGTAKDTVTSPDGHISVSFSLYDGKPVYEVWRDKQPIIRKSALGFITDVCPLDNGFKVLSKKWSSKDEIWQQPWGEDRLVRNNYNELKVSLVKKGGKSIYLNIIFRVFNDGVGFRYEFPKQAGLSEFKIMDELTEISFPKDMEAWTEPTNGTSYYEALWTKAPLSKKPVVSTPITIEADDSLYMVLHDAALIDYASLNYMPQKNIDGSVTMKADLTPWSNGVKVYAKAPCVTPWRTILITHTPGELITSRLMLNLNEPSRIKDTSWITTGKYDGIWWGMHMKDYTWAQGPKHGATTTNTKRYIDFAADHGLKGVLVEGWNYGWDGDWTKDGDKFSFSKPYPDYDLEGLQRYALSKGVSLVAHNETGGAITNYESQLDTAFALYHRLGIHVIKTGYVNRLMDNKEDQHSQYGIRHYQKVVETAAKYQIMVINHEPAMPSGLCRTWPNLMSGEGMRGQEYNAWSADGGNPPYHVCILPFTRGLAGSMDFTPGIFNFHNKAMPGTHPQTTLAKQLAEYIVLYAPWQMAADEIENYVGQPGFSWIETVPTNWEKTLVLNAKIGHYITTVRKDRDSDNWYLGAVTDEEPRNLSITLDFLDEGCEYIAECYADGEGADYRNNPYPLAYSRRTVHKGDRLMMKLAASGGTAIRFLKQTQKRAH